MCVGLVGNFTVWLAREGIIYEFPDTFSFFLSPSTVMRALTLTQKNSNLHK